MKIGIITLWQSNSSYGQLLQHYALQQYLRDKGHEPYLIRYTPKNDEYRQSKYKQLLKIFNPTKVILYIARICRTIQIHKEEANDQRKFDVFREQYIHKSDNIYYSYKELSKNPPKADVYIVGSDTVWQFLKYKNPEKVILFYKVYFLDFGNHDTIKISYAASICSETIDKNVIKIMAPLLKQFKYITVREKQSLNILKSCDIHNVEWVADPTLLHNADVYRMIYKKETIIKENEKYCLLYKINVSDNFSVKAVYKWAKKRNLKVIYVGEGQIDHHKKVNASVYDWLSLIDNAECVITNSFHGTIFSIIFHKKFAVFPLTGEYQNTNIRFYSLFELLGIEKRFIIGNNFDVFDKSINWDSITHKIEIIQRDNVLMRL